MPKPKTKIKIRKRWRINPQTKVESGAKRYCRKKTKKETRRIVKNEVKKNT